MKTRMFVVAPTLMLSLPLCCLLLLPASAQAAPPKLEVMSFGGDLEKWETTLPINAPKPYTFRWSTDAAGVTGAEWQVIEAPNGFGQPIGTSPTITASGVLQGPFAAGKPYKFPIDFKSVLPATAPAKVKYYWVRVVPKQGTQKLTPTSAVQVTYEKAGPAVKFDSSIFLMKFEQQLNTRLSGKAVGYQYAIYEGETLRKSGGSGYAILSSKKMTADTRMQTASITKTITAASMMLALEIVKPPKGLKANILPYLPSAWVPANMPHAPRVDEITIEDLLTHFSGLPGGGDDFDSLGQIIKQGAIIHQGNGGGPNQLWYGLWDYENANFCLCRVIVPYMLYGRNKVEDLNADLDGSPKGDTLAQRTSKLYHKFVKEKVFGPIGLGSVGVGPMMPKPDPVVAAKIKGLEAQIKSLQAELNKKAAPGEKADLANQIKELNAQVKALQAKLLIGTDERVRYYNFNNPSDSVQDSDQGDYNWFRDRVGSGHWFMSANEYGKFLAKLRHGKIVTAASYKQMTTVRVDKNGNNAGLGMYGASKSWGTYYTHNGGGYGDRMAAQWIMFPNDLSVVILVNSSAPLPDDLGTIMLNAYAAAGP
jgi:CubicO group peptidase (beta-lactamase class C family)